MVKLLKGLVVEKVLCMELLDKKFIAAIALVLGLNITGKINAQEIPNPGELLPDVEENETIEEIIPEPTLTPVQSWRRIRLTYILEDHQGAVDSLVFSPDSSLLISGGSTNDARMRIWSLATGKSVTEIRAQRSAILALAIDPYGETLISGGEDSGINIWDWQSGEYESAILDHESSITSLAITPDGKTLVSGGLDGMKVWDLETFPKYPYYTLADIGTVTNAIAINSNGYLVASGNNDGVVKFWNLRSGTFTSQFKPHNQLISEVVFTPDGKTLITASYDRTIKIWDLESGQLVNTLVGHTGEVRAITLHPMLPVLASGGNDGIILWNLETGELLTRLQEHRNWVKSLAFSPNGRYLASGGFDTTVKVWEDALAIDQEVIDDE
ncbi:MAG TPA: WD40 repeat domain-containing protein [Xenococcaceae cyanobacterium]